MRASRSLSSTGSTATRKRPDAGRTAMATDGKYGRQLRLWGANGQAALMGAHVLLLGAEPTGSETLKNLLLPGLGLVAVVDGGDVTAPDLASNFFVEPAALGRKRADVDVQLLCEMNPDGPRAAVDPAALSRPSRPSSPTAATPPPSRARCSRCAGAWFALWSGCFVLVFFSVLFPLYLGLIAVYLSLISAFSRLYLRMAIRLTHG